MKSPRRFTLYAAEETDRPCEPYAEVHYIHTYTTPRYTVLYIYIHTYIHTRVYIHILLIKGSYTHVCIPDYTVLLTLHSNIGQYSEPYTYIHTYIHTYTIGPPLIKVYIHTYIHVQGFPSPRWLFQSCRVDPLRYGQSRNRRCVCIPASIYVCLNVCMYIYMYVCM